MASEYCALPNLRTAEVEAVVRHAVVEYQNLPISL
jgi:hypothetical protein